MRELKFASVALMASLNLTVLGQEQTINYAYNEHTILVNEGNGLVGKHYSPDSYRIAPTNYPIM